MFKEDQIRQNLMELLMPYTSCRCDASVKADLRLSIFVGNILLLEDRKHILLSASRSQFVARGPAKILKIGQQITVLWPKWILNRDFQ